MIKKIKHWLGFPTYENGLIKQDVDSRDYEYTPKVGSTLPDEVDLSNEFPSIKNQLYESCVGYTVGDLVLNKLYKELKVKIIIERDVISYAFLWYNMRLLEGNERFNTGVMLRDGFKAVKKYGYTFDKLYSNRSHWGVKPRDRAYKHANLTKWFLYTGFMGSYRRVNPFMIKQTLAEGKPVVFGMFTDNAFANTNGYIHINNARGNAHAMIAVGYKKVGGEYYIKIRNSWGTRFGIKGHAFIKESVFTKNWSRGGAFDLWCLD